MTMPWIAFVPDISGVCSIVGTFEITSKPDEHGQREHGQLDDQGLGHAVLSSSRALMVSLRISPAWQTSASDTISSDRSSSTRPSPQQQGEQRRHVARVELARVLRHLRRRVARADQGHGVPHDRLAGLGQLAVAARVGGQIDDHRAGRASIRPSPPSRGAGAGRPGHQGRRDHDVGVGDVRGRQLLLQPSRLLGQLAGVAALALARLRQLDLEEARRRGSRPARARRDARRRR